MSTPRVALVTGAGRRIAIGAAIARRLVADGFAVLVHDWSAHDAEQPWGVDEGGAQALVDELRAAGGRAEHVAADLADPAAPAVLVEAARRALTASVAVPLIARGITVNCVDPGPTDTGWADDGTKAAVTARHPAGRWSTPEDIARAVAWLVSDEGGWMTGQVLAVDGGWSVR